MAKFLATLGLFLASVSGQDEACPKGGVRLIYLTSDDGPYPVSENLLDVAKERKVPLTFFVNGDRTDLRHWGWGWDNYKRLERMVDEGHLVGDHSVDHMARNGETTSANTYRDVEKDLERFGKNHFAQIIKSSKGEMRRRIYRSLKDSLTSYVRLPYTNNWRFTMPDGSEIRHDCHCTTGENSSEIGYKIADRLHEQGAQVVGWDEEHHKPAETKSIEFLRTANEMVDECRTKRPNKLVVLTHDEHWKNPKDFDKLIKLFNADGWVFRRMDKYATDDPFDVRTLV